MLDTLRAGLKRLGQNRALLVALAYLTLSALWIFLSGNLLDLLPIDEGGRSKLEMYKGLFYVLNVTGALYLVLRTWRSSAADSSTKYDGDNRVDSKQTAVWLLLIYLLGLILLVSTSGYLVFENIKHSETRKIEQNLGMVAQLKAEQINSWVKQNINYAAVAGNESYLASNFDIWVRDGKLAEDKAQWVRRRLDTLRKNFLHGELALVDLNGKIYLSTGDALLDAAHVPDLLKQAAETKRPVMGRMHWHTRADGSRVISLPMAAPLLPSGMSGKVSGVLLFELNPEQHLFPLAQSWPTPSASAETVLIQQDGDNVTYLNELRHGKATALTQKNIAANPTLLAVQALKAGDSFISGRDYRGVPVIGHASKITGTDWFMLAKVDTEEIYQPIRRIAINVTLIVLLLASVASLALLFWWRHRRAQYQAAQLNAELKQQALVKHFDFLSKYANDIILLMDEDGIIVEANDSAEAAYGLLRQQLIGRHARTLRSSDAPGSFEQSWDATLQHNSQLFESRHVRSDGTAFPVAVSTRQIETDKGKYIQGIIRNITERKQAEGRMQRLVSILRALSAINGAITRLDDASALFPLVCRTAVEFGGMALAWVGALDESGEKIVPLARSGKATSYLDSTTILFLPDVPESKGPVGVTYRENKVVVINDFQAGESTMPWREKAMLYGINSIATFPILRGGNTYAVLAVCSDLIDAFDKEIIDLLEDMAKGISFALDNFDREKARSQAEDGMRLAAKVFDSSHGSITITDTHARIVAVNPAFTQITGYSAEDVLGKNPNLLNSGRQGTEFYQSFWAVLTQTGRWQGEMWNRRKNGEEYAAWLSVSALRDEKGVTTHYIGIADDITENKKNERRIEFLAYHDALTGLPNRLLANDRLEQAIAHAHRAKTRVAVLFLDLDDFKMINDTLGHSTGDAMLKAVAERLLSCVRESGTVSRQGGDEFLVMLNDITDVDTINNVAIKILEEINKHFQIDKQELSISTSIGIAIYPDDGQNCDTLMKSADMAMYNAKQSGRNTHRFFAEEMNSYVLEHLLIRNGLIRALDNSEFVLHYQPQLDLGKGNLLGAEALIRWQHPELGMVPPNRFIQVAEESGMIIPIGNWVIQEACRQAMEWHQSGWPDLVVGVNISALQFRRGDMEQIVSAALAKSGLAPQCLELELTESILIQDVEKSLDTIRRLKDLGVRLSIDDFGTGYSSLAYLRRLPVDKLKIDQSFVRDITTRQDDAAIALSIIMLAHTLQKTVIAEGVETVDQLQFLREHGCDEIQGYLLSRPLPPDAFADFLKRGVQMDFLQQG